MKFHNAWLIGMTSFFSALLVNKRLVFKITTLVYTRDMSGMDCMKCSLAIHT